MTNVMYEFCLPYFSGLKYMCVDIVVSLCLSTSVYREESEETWPTDMCTCSTLDIASMAVIADNYSGLSAANDRRCHNLMNEFDALHTRAIL